MTQTRASRINLDARVAVCQLAKSASSLGVCLSTALRARFIPNSATEGYLGNLGRSLHSEANSFGPTGIVSVWNGGLTTSAMIGRFARTALNLDAAVQTLEISEKRTVRCKGNGYVAAPPLSAKL